MSTSVEWHRSLPPDIKAQVRPWIAKYKFLIPTWLRCLSIRYQDNIGGSWVAEIDVQWEYRQARLVIVPIWREQDEAFQELTIAHELTHIALAPMDSWTKTLIESVTDEPLRAVLEKDWERMHEGSTEDISLAIHRRIKDGR